MRLMRWVLLVALWMVSWNVFAMGGPLVTTDNRLVGKAAPDFTLPTLAGKKTHFAEYRDGKKAIIFFWATWCPHCREALEEINHNRADFEKKDIRLVLVDIGETQREVRAHVAKHKMELNVFLDEASEVSGRYGIIGVPTFFFVNSSATSLASLAPCKLSS